MAQVQILMNPARMKLGRGKAIRLSQAGGHPKGEVHIKRPNANYALCGAGSPSSYKSAKTRRKVIAAGTRVVTCYRCIKLYRMNQGHTEDQLLRFPANKQVHHLISGGREGARVSKSKPYTRKVKAERLLEGFGRFTTSQGGAQTRGPKSHPTQTRMLPEAAKAWRRTRAGGAQLKLIANPRFFGMGYAKGIKDYRSAVPTPATTLKQRSMSYQRGYLEGYADTADKKAARANPKKRSNPTRRKNASKALRKRLPKKIEIWGKRWFQKTYGNTYHTTRIYFNDKLVFESPRGYGYGDGYIQTAKDWLVANRWMPANEPVWRYFRDDKGIDYSAHATDVKRQRDL
jgi:hypothetical protein